MFHFGLLTKAKGIKQSQTFCSGISFLTISYFAATHKASQPLSGHNTHRP
jgi:hypothetical protein